MDSTYLVPSLNSEFIENIDIKLSDVGINSTEELVLFTRYCSTLAFIFRIWHFCSLLAF
jgi:hypothetical protein